MKGWLLDTNVVSELAKASPDAPVASWAEGQPDSTVFVSVLSLGEFEQGIGNLPPSHPARDRYQSVLQAIETDFAGRIVGVEDAIVRLWGRMSGEALRRDGKLPPVIDTMLAATATEKRLYLATRNVRDMRATGVVVFNPWTDDPARFPLTG